MTDALTQFIPKEGSQILLVLFLTFLIGLEREEHAPSGPYRFGGVRSFPLLGLLGYALCLVSAGDWRLPAVGLAVVGAFLWQSYRHKLDGNSQAGMTTEISGLLAYALGALVWREEYWIATTLTVITVVLLELKRALEDLSRRLPAEELLTFAKFLLLTAVILPVVPSQTVGSFGFNPFKTWLVVVAVSTMSYGSYLLQRWTRGHGGVLVSALLGGAYSSTLATVVLAKRAREQSRPHLYSGSMLVASGMMYFRLLTLIAIFNHQLFAELALPFLVLGAGAILGGWMWAHRSDAGGAAQPHPFQPRNPLELGAALLFGGLFVAMLFITHVALVHLGRTGLYTLAAVMGVSDVDPFILGLAQSAGTTTPVALAAGAITIAASGNNVMKGAYAYGFADHRTGSQGLWLLVTLALLGLLPLFF